MANLNLSMFWICSSFILYLLLCFLNKGDALRGRDNHYLTVQVSSLLPSSVCDPSTQGPNKRASSLKLVHRHGPCSPLKKANNSPTLSQILSNDQTRVSLIQSRIALASKTTNEETDSKVTLPARLGVTQPSRLGRSQDSGNYIVNVGLGTPKKVLSLMFDTGSALTWTRFNLSGSTTYSIIRLRPSECGKVADAYTGVDGRCNYNISYHDNTYSVGWLAKETLTMSTDVFPGFIFGASSQNTLYDKNEETDGLLGLGREELSFVSQTAQKYGKYFSYCLPSKSSSTGHLTFGKEGVSSRVKFTPFTSSPDPSLYSIEIKAIYVGGTKLSITSVNSGGNTVIDSGTVVTRLLPATYNMLRGTFRKTMMKYPMAKPDLPLFDTCYDLSNYPMPSLPMISFLFGGDVMVDMDPSGILVGDRPSQMCLAFSNDNVNILGNVQQKTLEVVYDVEGGKLGFGKRGCA